MTVRRQDVADGMRIKKKEEKDLRGLQQKMAGQSSAMASIAFTRSV